MYSDSIDLIRFSEHIRGEDESPLPLLMLPIPAFSLCNPRRFGDLFLRKKLTVS
jgi:hypothetical protein